VDSSGQNSSLMKVSSGRGSGSYSGGGDNCLRQEPSVDSRQMSETRTVGAGSGVERN
jgi:hypothetical protein